MRGNTMNTPIRAASIDELLGDASGRFFGSLYRGAQQQSSLSFQARDPQSWSVQGSAMVRYPADWGRRGQMQRLPHLSTIDVVLFLAHIGSRFGELNRRSGSIAPTDIVALTHVVLRAGSAPIEALENVPILGILSVQNRAVHAEVKIGNMRTSADYAIITNDWGESGRASHRAGDAPVITLTQVEVDAEAHTARCRIGLSGRVEAVPGDLRVVANIVACSQTAQALIAAVDDLSREDSDTLWMRKYEGWINPPGHPDQAEACVSVDQHRTMNVGDRVFSMFAGQARGYGVDSRFSLAHAIPHGPVARAA